MIEFLERLRAKSTKAKKRIAFLASFSFAGLIFVVWLSVVWPDWLRLRGALPPEEKVASEPSPLETVSNAFGQAAGAIGSQLGDLKAVIANLATTTEALSEAASTSTGASTTGAENRSDDGTSEALPPPENLEYVQSGIAE